MKIQINGHEFPLQEKLSFLERSSLRNAIGSIKWNELNNTKSVFVTTFEGMKIFALKDNENEIYLDYPDKLSTVQSVALIHSQ